MPTFGPDLASFSRGFKYWVCCIGKTVSVSFGVTRNTLDACSDKRVAFARFDGVSRHADGLKRGRTVPVNSGARYISKAGQHCGGAPNIETLFTAWRTSSHN